MLKLVVTAIGLLVSIRGIRIYSRTGLKGELLVAVAGFIFALSYQANDMPLAIIGYIILNIGMLILYKVEKIKWKAIFGKLTYLDKVVGNTPHFLNEKESRTTYKVTGVISGIFCFLMAFEIYRKVTPTDIGNLLEKNLISSVEIGTFILAGTLLIGYYLFKKVE